MDPSFPGEPDSIGILSPSTKDYDRGEKLSQYKQLPSLQAVLLVAHDARRVTAVMRGAGGWTTTEHQDTDVIVLAQPALTLPVREFYRPLESLG